MVLPIADDNSDRMTVPVVNYVLIAINVFVFVVLQGLGENQKFTYAFSTVPREIATGKDEVTPRSLTFMGLKLSEYEQDREFLEQLMKTLTYEE